MKKRRNGFVGNLLGWWTPVRRAGLIIGLIGIAISVFGVLYKGSFAHDIVQDFYANIGTECISIAVTIVLIDRLYELRDEQREKDRLVREMRNPDNGLALLAVEELRAQDWLDDTNLLVGKYLWDSNLAGVKLVGVDLRRAYLNRANLQNANLDAADLEGAHLDKADLTGAHLDKARLDRADLRGATLAGARLIKASLRHAHLHGVDFAGVHLDDADLSGAQFHHTDLSKADRLRGATMSDGSRYDGRYNLKGDFEASLNHSGTGRDDPELMAHYYGVSLAEYERGQEWALEGSVSGQA